jgi:hypothetical protein
LSEILPSRILDRAADILMGPDAWTQGAMGRDEFGAELEIDRLDCAMCFCAVGALHVARPMPNLDVLTSMAAVQMAMSLGWQDDGHRLPGDAIAAWNDEPGRTVAEVIGAMRASAIASREVGL